MAFQNSCAKLRRKKNMKVNIFKLTKILLMMAGIFTCCTRDYAINKEKDESKLVVIQNTKEEEKQISPTEEEEEQTTPYEWYPEYQTDERIEEILGKWELVCLKPGSYGGLPEEQVEPIGYIEYLIDGDFAWYEYKSEVYALYGKYKLEKKYYDKGSELEGEFFWVLCYEINKEFEQEQSAPEVPMGIGKPHGGKYHLRMPDSNTMILISLDYISIFGQRDRIYKRKY